MSEDEKKRSPVTGRNTKDPFKTRKSRVEQSASQDTISPPEEVAQAIDGYREAQEQSKYFEGEATVHKDAILSYAASQYSSRVFNGLPGPFKLLGAETMVSFVVQDASAGLTEEDVEAFATEYGDEAADALIQRDFRSIRFDAKVLEANYDKVIEALQVLPADVLDRLFKPMLMKASPGAVDKAKSYAKSPEELDQILQKLRMRHFIR